MAASLRIAFCTDGSFSARERLSDSTFSTSGGVPAGAARPYHCVMVISMPSSLKVGTSGNTGLRWLPVRASTRNWPCCTCGTSGDAVAKNMSICPPIMSVMAGPDPLYGTCSSFRWPSSLIVSMPMWAAPPVPVEAKVISLPFAEPMTSWAVLKRDCVATNRPWGASRIRPTGAKSSGTLYGRLCGLSAGDTARLPLMASRMV
ncbi:hypothetical protein D3C86_1132320 [compost metagenome]